MGVFANKLPKNLAIPIQEQLDSYMPIFKKYARSESVQYYGSVGLNFETSCQILELALFYKNIVVPMSNGSNSFVTLQGGNFDKVKIGNYILTKTERGKIKLMEQDFYELLRKFEIPTHLLLFSDLKDFARNLNIFYEQNQSK